MGAFSPTERMLFLIFVGLFIASCIGMLWHVNSALLTEVPTQGGTFVEGIVGTPRFINPLLAASDADQDLTSLIYAGLLKPTVDGTLAGELAESYSISEDGLTYTFLIRDGAVFHDGTAVTAQDVVFTIERAQDPALKSPRRANWEGVHVQAISEKEVQFTLPQPYGAFLENTVMGILPKHLWENVNPDQFAFSQFNVQPVGAGPYEIKRIYRNESGLPESYELIPFNAYSLGEAHIEKLIIKFYPSEEELLIAHASGAVDAISSISPYSLARITGTEYEIIQAPLPRVFGVFFNQNVAPIFANKAAREAVQMSVDRDAIIEEILGGYGRASIGPIPPGILQKPAETPPSAEDVESGEVVPEAAAPAPLDHAAAAKSILQADGWKINEEGLWNKTIGGEVQTLRFGLSTANSPELKAVAETLKRQWEAAGIPVELKFFDTSDLNQNVIRPRRYDALLFGEIVGRELDLFPFWHSSQRNDPGLNIALYANISADRLLQEARTTSDLAEKTEALQAFEEEVADDIPAVFIYSPDFIYVVPKHVQGVNLGPLTTSGERFLSVHEWYIETERIWPLFRNIADLHFLP